MAGPLMDVKVNNAMSDCSLSAVKTVVARRDELPAHVFVLIDPVKVGAVRQDLLCAVLAGGVRAISVRAATLLILERETGFEPAMSSLGIWMPIENKQQCRLRRRCLIYWIQRLPKLRTQTTS